MRTYDPRIDEELRGGELSKRLEKILLHDETCTMPDPQGCSCGAILARFNIKSLIKQHDRAMLKDVIGDYTGNDLVLKSNQTEQRKRAALWLGEKL